MSFAQHRESDGSGEFDVGSRGQSPTQDDAMSQATTTAPTNKSEKRLARKAELARASRRRKKAHVQELEEKVTRLAMAIDSLRASMPDSPRMGADQPSTGAPSSSSSASTPSASSSSTAVPSALSAAMGLSPPASPGIGPRSWSPTLEAAGAVDANAANPAFAAYIKELQEQAKKWLLSCNEHKENTNKPEFRQLMYKLLLEAEESSRQSTANLLIKRLDGCLSPGVQTRFLLWLFDQRPEFYEGPGMWTSLLVKELGCDDDQIDSLRRRRDLLQQDRKAMEEVNKQFKELASEAVGVLREVEGLMRDVYGGLSSQQLAKLYFQLEANAWLKDGLNKAWP